MLTKRHIISALLASALSVTAVSATTMSAQAQSWGGRLNAEAQRSITPAEAKTIARKHVPNGQVVVIKKSGKVVDVLIDANTGRVK